MIDRHRSLIHTALAGLVGLTVGLFIGWWVWPVQWIEAPGTAPAATAPVQSEERQAAETAEPESNYSAFLDWVSQGLLYVAAALLLVGGVVIGYQLLRQSQGKDSAGPPFPLPFNRSRSNQATAARELRAKTPPLAGRPSGQRQPSMKWLHRESDSESASTAEEPVFREQSFSAPRPGEWTSGSPVAGGEPSLQGVQGSEADPISSQQDDILSPEEITEHIRDSSSTPAGHQAKEEPGLESPESFDAPETAATAIHGGEDDQDDERYAEGLPGGLARTESAADGDGDRGGDVLPAGGTPADHGSEELEERQASERPEHREDSRQASSVGPATFADHEEPDEEAGTEFIRSETGPVNRTSRQLAGQFEANYAFGIRSYDESFTINAADGELLGACGVGINESVDRDAANTEQVRLLDVWLYDRSAVRSVSQPLVSPGFDVSGLDDYTDGSGSDSSFPLEVVPGLTCTLQSDSIEVECSVKSATFLEGEPEPMPFRSVSVSLSVYVLA